MTTDENYVDKRLSQVKRLQTLNLLCFIVPAIVLWVVHSYTTLSPVGDEWVLRLLVVGIAVWVILISYGTYQFKKRLVHTTDE